MKALFANGPVPGVQPEKKIVWNTERIKWWLANGAQPSETVVKLLEKVSRRPCRIYPLHHPLSTRSSPAFIAPPPPSLLLDPLIHPLTLTACLQGGVLTGNHKWKIAYKQPKPKSTTKAE